MVNISRAATVAAGLLGSSIASAGAISIGTTGSVVGADGVGVRPGLSVGYLPTPSTALELHGDSSFDGAWDVGLVLAGRWYPSPALEPGRGSSCWVASARASRASRPTSGRGPPSRGASARGPTTG